MALPEGVNKRWASAAAILLLIIWLWVAFDRPYSFPYHTPWNNYAGTPLAPDTPPAYIPPPKYIFEFPPVESDAIKNMCSGTQWNDTLVFMCDSADGNVAQIRTGMLMCVRYAIMAGANLVLPRLINGDGKHEMPMRVPLDWDRKQFDFMFDEGHFLDSMSRSCPEMKVYKGRNEIRFPDNYVRPPVITLQVEGLIPRRGEDWRTEFYNVVHALISPTEDTKPVIIEVPRPTPNYDVHSDGIQFVQDFGNLLKFKPDVRALAHKVIAKLNETYNFPVNEDDPILRDAFFGVHLYTEEERRVNEGWLAVDWDHAKYEPETKHYFDQAAQKGHRVIYVASQRQDEYDRFTIAGKALSMNVHTKYDLLEGNDKNALNGLTKDEQVLVDFLVLLKASDFAGIGHSSLSWNVALKRHQFAKERKPVVGPRVFQDDLSHLYGTLEEGKSLYNNMWP